MELYLYSTYALRGAVIDNITLLVLVLLDADKVTSGEGFSRYFGFAL